jgi:hypothetical protein
MAETFYGDWLVRCIEKDSDFEQRFKISGSDSSDSTYNGTPGTQIDRVSGQQWSIEMEWNDNAGSGWQPSDIGRSAASYTVQEGLVITLGADDNWPEKRDGDYNDLIIVCKSLDPAINPNPPPPNPPHFTISNDMIKDR